MRQISIGCAICLVLPLAAASLNQAYMQWSRGTFGMLCNTLESYVPNLHLKVIWWHVDLVWTINILYPTFVSWTRHQKKGFLKLRFIKNKLTLYKVTIYLYNCQLLLRGIELNSNWNRGLKGIQKSEKP